jgi:hypothetical protein
MQGVLLSRFGALRLGLALTLIAALCALIGASSASAAGIVNGSFETGNLEGWTVDASNPEVGWTVGCEVEDLPQPFEGRCLAGSGEGAPGTAILYQDIPLEPASTDTLAMTFGYISFQPLVTPQPNSLDAEGPFPNQQVRVDVIKPTAPIDSVESSDILATVFASSETENVSEEAEMEPRRFSVDLTPFAGQTVRLRLAVASSSYPPPLIAFVDAVSIASTRIPAPPAPTPTPTSPPLSNRIIKGKLTLNKKNGTGSLAVTVPAAGTLTAQDASTKIAIATASAKGGRKPALIKTTVMHPSAAGTIKVPIKPTASGRRLLRESGKLKFRARLIFTPTGGTAATQVYKAQLVKTLKPRR